MRFLRRSLQRSLSGVLHRALPGCLFVGAWLVTCSSLAPPVRAQGACGNWEVVPTPFLPGWLRARFQDVSALPDGPVWAVGYADYPITSTNYERRTLAMRYENGQWTHTPTPYNPPSAAGAWDILYAVEAIAPDDVWAAGRREQQAAGSSVGGWIYVVHWDGSSWSDVAVPQPPGGNSIHYQGLEVLDILSFGPDDVWFVGLWAEPNALFSVTWRPLALHWNGSSMTLVDTPVIFTGTNPVQLEQVDGVQPDDIWGVCNAKGNGNSQDPVLLHWDGSTWSQVAAPSLGTLVRMNDVVAVASDDVWFFGHRYFPTDPFALHWDGSSFTVLDDVPFVSSATVQRPGEIYLAQNEIRHFDGSTVTVVETFPGVNTPGIAGTDSIRGACVSWAVGSHFVTGTTKGPFAARLVAGSWASFCAGDGSASSCPCGNTGAVGHGCANGSSASGALLSALGSASLGDADLVLRAQNSTPGQPGLFYQGQNAVQGGAGVPFGDGLRCAGGGVVRLEVAIADGAGTANSTVAVAAAGGATPGAVLRYQWWYRDPAGSPCGATFNLSNGLEITWSP